MHVFPMREDRCASQPNDEAADTAHRKTEPHNLRWGISAQSNTRAALAIVQILEATRCKSEGPVP